MIGNHLGLDFLLGVKILRPTIGSWKVVEPNRTWADFESGRATVVRRIRATWYGRHCWIVAHRTPNSPFAVMVAQGIKAAARPGMATGFTFYASNPAWHGLGETATLGGGFFIPKRLPQAYAEAKGRKRRVALTTPGAAPAHHIPGGRWTFHRPPAPSVHNTRPYNMGRFLRSGPLPYVSICYLYDLPRVSHSIFSVLAPWSRNINVTARFLVAIRHTLRNGGPKFR